MVAFEKETNTSYSSALQPWLRDFKSRIDNPIDPIDEHDSREAIKDLLARHHNKLEKLKHVMKDDPLYKPEIHDDLWLLRYLLSHKGKVKAASVAAKSTLVYRKEHRLDLFDVRHLAPPPLNKIAV